jgi:hypothetical protein
MSYQSALDYIRAGRVRGLSDTDIATRLRGVGWRSADVQDAFALMASMGRVPEPVARLASTPTVLERPIMQPRPQPTPEPQPLDHNPTGEAVPEPQQAPVQAPVVSAQPKPAVKTRTTSLQWVGWIAIVIAAFVFGYMLM